MGIRFGKLTWRNSSEGFRLFGMDCNGLMGVETAC